MGAGTPGFHTKQQQNVPPSPLPAGASPKPDGDGGKSSASCSCGSSSSGGGSSSNSSSPTGGSGKPGSPAKRPASPDAGGGSSSIDGEGAEHSGSFSGGASPDGSGGMMKPSEHEQGIWNGLLSIFRFEKKRQSITGLPSNLLGDLEARARPGETLALGVPHDLPRPNSPAALHLEIPAADASSSLLKPNVLGSGRRGSRSIPGISPRGSTPDGAETAEE